MAAAEVRPLVLTPSRTPGQKRLDDAEGLIIQIADEIGAALEGRGAGYDVMGRMLRACTELYRAKRGIP